MLGARALFDLQIDDETLHQWALELGADVPFFLKGGAAVGCGVGEILTPIELLADYKLVLMNPGFPVSTARVFREFSSSLTEIPDRGTVWGLLQAGGGVERLLLNDLQETTERLYPEVGDVRRFIERFNVRGALMSGSGPTVFGIVDPDTDIAVQTRKSAPKHWTVFETTPINSGPEID